MATLQATTASNCPRIAPESTSEVEAIISDYDFPGTLRNLIVELMDADGSDEDDSVPRLTIRGGGTFDATKPIENADGDVVDRDHGHTREFLERLAPHLEKCLVVETVGHKKYRFPLLASQWVAWPDGIIESTSFDHNPTHPTPRDDSHRRPPLHSLSERTRSNLSELATYDDRRYLLWELAADQRTFCGVEFLVDELGLEDASVSEQVERFVDDLQTHSEAYLEGVNWAALEATWGHIVDAYLPDESPVHHLGVSESHGGDR
jgi:hypothetical protein